MPLAVVRTCGRCGRPETPRRTLLTIGELLEIHNTQPFPFGPALFDEAYCKSKVCILVALGKLGQRQLYGKFHSGHGRRTTGARK